MKVDLEAAIAFVEDRGGVVERARLRYLLAAERPSQEATTTLLADQRADGGWPPFWSPGTSSLDATCFRLAQAEQMGISGSEAANTRAARFLLQRQRADGSWEEDEAVADLAPPWAKPGDIPARLYLTANCGFWLAVLGEADSASRAADHLRAHLSDDGRLPAAPHAHWLAGGLWYRLGQRELAGRVLDFLGTRLHDLHASNLAWLITTLRTAGVPPDRRLVSEAAAVLGQRQSPDGRWPSEDGAEWDVHSTLEALWALRLCGRLAN